MAIEYMTGNIFKTKCKIIAQAVDCQGRMNSGIGNYIKEKYPHVYQRYVDLIKESRQNYDMAPTGISQFIPMSFKDRDIKMGEITYRGKYIVNMFTINEDLYGNKQTSLDTVRSCMEKIYRQTNLKNGLRKARVAFPHKVCVVPGQVEWNDVVAIIESVFQNRKVEIWTAE